MSTKFIQLPLPLSRAPHEHYEMLDGCVRDAGNESEAYQSYDVSKSDSQILSLEGAHHQICITRPSWRRVGNSFWLLEFGCWLLGLGCLAATVGVLAHFDGRTVPVLERGISLGAVVSVLSTAATVFLTTPLAAGIGQARWLWFRRKRTLADFELITDAARSPYSALELIVRRRGGFLAMFGAFFIVVVLAMNPFAQQAIKTDTRQALRHANATIRITSHYTNNSPEGADGVNVALIMKAAIYRGLLQIEADNTAFDVKPQCSTGNCNWTEYATLSVCARCVDLTDQLSSVGSTSSADQLTASLPNGLNLSWSEAFVEQGLKTLTVNNTNSPSGTRLESIHFKNISYALADVFAIVGPYGRRNKPYASECLLQFCAETMNSTVVDGLFQENVTGNPLYLDHLADGNVSTSNGNKSWTVERETHRGLAFYFGNLFESYVPQSNTSKPGPQWPDDISQAVFHYMNKSTPQLDGLFNDLARSMGQHIRAQDGEPYLGDAMVQETFINVRWPWMILPIIVVVAVLIFLVASIIATSRASLEPWKESSTALLAHGLDDRSRPVLSAIDKKWEMDEVASQLHMCLDRVDGALNLRIHSRDRI